MDYSITIPGMRRLRGTYDQERGSVRNDDDKPKDLAENGQSVGGSVVNKLGQANFSSIRHSKGICVYVVIRDSLLAYPKRFIDTGRLEFPTRSVNILKRSIHRQILWLTWIPFDPFLHQPTPPLMHIHIRVPERYFLVVAGRHPSVGCYGDRSAYLLFAVSKSI